MKTYKGLRGILAALGLSALATTAGHAAPRLAISPLGNTTHVDPTSGARTVAEWDFHSEAE